MNHSGHQTEIFRLNSHTDRSAFEALIDSRPDLDSIDNILPQMHDLIKIRRPDKTYSEQELSEAVEPLLVDSNIQEFGCWVHYPWSRRIVHLLDQEDFTSVRTNRNKLKITEEEQSALVTKTIGLIGLSVGHAVAMTLALERDFGELRIADFDELDLSNLNRIRSGVHNINIPKTTIVAREIAELDPFLNVVCYDQGLTESNMDDFLNGNGGLDLLIDECDSLDIKILVRERARASRIPVIMETSDRGMLDVERFDEDPNLPILHGLVEDLRSEDLSNLTNEEKIPYVLSILEMDQCSDKLKASMEAIGKSIKTWPQLGSDVLHGGATTTNVARRILLKERIRSGRFRLDLHQLIPNSELISSAP